jgi:hypothetical protein
MKTKTLALVTATFLLIGGATAQQQTTSINPILINTDPAPVQSGEDAEIMFKLRNTGNSVAEDVEVQLVDSFPFQVKPDRKRIYSLGDMSPEREYHISTEVLVADDAPDGVNEFKVKIIQGDVSVAQDIPVQVQSQDIELNLANLKTTPTQLTPDMENVKLTVEVVNNGEKTAENAVINIELPEGFEQISSFSTRQAIGNMAPGQVKPAEFTFDIGKDAESGEVSIPADISYSTGDSSNRVTEEAGFSFNLAGRPQFEVTRVQGNLKQGSTKEIRLTVSNTGSETSSSTRIRVLDSSDQPFSYGSSSQYIGTLEAGQNGTAVFDITAESTAEVKDYLIDFEIRGVKDTQVYVEDTTVRAAVENGEKSGSPVPVVIVALAAVGVIGYLFRDRIRRRLEN